MKQKSCISPNIRQIKKVTGFHRATIKSSIDFMETQNFIQGYRPLLDPSLAGYSLKSHSFFQIDPSFQDSQKGFINALLRDKNVISASSVISEGDFNLAVSFLSKDIETFHSSLKEKYLYKLTNYYDFVKKTSNFYLSKPFHKSKNQIDVLIDLLMQEQGL